MLTVAWDPFRACRTGAIAYRAPHQLQRFSHPARVYYIMAAGSTNNLSIAGSMGNGMNDEVRTIVGAALEVHAQLGPGYMESVYQEALAMEFGIRGITFQREVHVPVFYKGMPLTNWFRADFVCGATVVELKAVNALTAKDDVQVRSYLKAIGLQHGLLFNFGQARLQFKRLLMEQLVGMQRD